MIKNIKNPIVGILSELSCARYTPARLHVVERLAVEISLPQCSFPQTRRITLTRHRGAINHTSRLQRNDPREKTRAIDGIN